MSKRSPYYTFTLSMGLVRCERTEDVNLQERLGLSDEEWGELSDDEADETAWEEWREWVADNVQGGPEARQ